jgi:fermentation-respiration switch protein FrsA (DUF1100 family)
MFSNAHRRSALTAFIAALAIGACTPDRITAPSAVSAHDPPDNSAQAQRGHLVDARFVRTAPRSLAAHMIDSVHAGAAFVARYDVEQWSVDYYTVDAFGERVIASGGVFLAVGVNHALPLVSFSHGTEMDKTKVASNPASINTQGILQASHGSVAVVADYLGLGDDAADPQTYLNADVLATTSEDALDAAIMLARRREIELDGRLFIYGYSEGGQAAMALARAIETDPHAHLTVTAAAPMSGPYAMDSTARVVIADTRPLTQNTVNALMLMSAYETMYDVAPSLSDLVISPFDAVGERIMRDGISAADIAALQPPPPTTPREILTPLALAMLDDPSSPLREALRRNDTFDWTPVAPMRLYFGERDQQVPPFNAPFTALHMTARGAGDVQAVDVGPVTHGGAQWPAFIAARAWFDTFHPPPVLERSLQR